MNLSMKWILVLGAAILLLCAAGCTQPSPEEAEAQLCADLAKLDAALQEYDALDENATLAEVRAAQDNVTSAWSDVRDSAQARRDVNVDQLDAAYNDLENAVNDLPEDITIAEARTQLQPQIDAVKQALQQVFSSANCGT
jgi:outer membrane murein-binding lipoprotein Lpp